MEKDNRNICDITEDNSLGSVKIADDVVASIVGLAAAEVDGIAAVGGISTEEMASKSGVKSISKGVKVVITDKTVKLDINLSMKYGFNIPETCTKVQEKIKVTVDNMTGLEVSDINVHIVGVDTKLGRD